MRATTCGVSSVYSCNGRPSQKERVASRKSRMAAVISGYRAVAARRAYSTRVRVLPPLVKLPEIPRSVAVIERPHVIAPKGHRTLTGGATPGVGVRTPSLFGQGCTLSG